MDVGLTLTFMALSAILAGSHVSEVLEIGNWLYHYVWIDIGVPIWPNIIASVIIAGYIDVKSIRRHKELKRQIQNGD